MKSIEMMNIEEVKSMKKQFLKAKEKRLKEKEFLLNKSTENLIPSCIEDNSKAINEENAIKLLKSLGYKILKPIEPQYREI